MEDGNYEKKISLLLVIAVLIMCLVPVGKVMAKTATVSQCKHVFGNNYYVERDILTRQPGSYCISITNYLKTIRYDEYHDFNYSHMYQMCRCGARGNYKDAYNWKIYTEVIYLKK